MRPDVAGEAAFHRATQRLDAGGLRARGSAGAHRASRRSRRRRASMLEAAQHLERSAAARIDGTWMEARSSAGGYSSTTVLALSIRPEQQLRRAARGAERLQRIAEQHQAVAAGRVVVFDLLEFARHMAHPARPAVELVGLERRRLGIDRQHRQRGMGQIVGDRPEMPADLDDMRAVAHEMRGQHLPDRRGRSGQMRDVVAQRRRRGGASNVVKSIRSTSIALRSRTAAAYNSAMTDATQPDGADDDWRDRAFDLTRGIAAYSRQPAGGRPGAGDRQAPRGRHRQRLQSQAGRLQDVGARQAVRKPWRQLRPDRRSSAAGMACWRRCCSRTGASPSARSRASTSIRRWRRLRETLNRRGRAAASGR